MATHEENDGIDSSWDEKPSKQEAASPKKPASPMPAGMGASGGPARVRPVGSRKTVLGMGSIKPPAPAGAPDVEPAEKSAQPASPRPPAAAPKPAAAKAVPAAPVAADPPAKAMPQVTAKMPVVKPAAVEPPEPNPVAATAPSPAVATPTLDDVTHADGGSAEAAGNDPDDLDQPTEIDGDVIAPDRAYFAPRAVPKAALPTDEEQAKVVINIPTPMGGTEEITQAIDRDALVRQMAREEQIALARRREPTVRIPRKDVQAVRAEIAAQERAAAGIAAYEPSAPLDDGDADATASATDETEVTPARERARSADIEPTVGAPRATSSRFTVVALLAAAVAVAGGATWYVTQKGADTSTARTDGSAATGKALADASPATKSATMAASESAAPETVSPPLQLSADATASADPNVVTLNAAAAQGHPPIPGKPTATPSAKPPTTSTQRPTAGPPYGSGTHPPTATPSAKPFKPVIPTEI